MFRIGCHLSSSKGFLAMAKQAEEIGANTFQFFTRNPRGGKAKDLDVKDIAAYQQYAAEHGIGQILAHAPYTINACGKDERVQEFARETMADDLRRLEEIPDCKYNFHPGSHVQQGAEVGIEKIAGVLNEIMWQEQKTTVLLETMAGKGTEVGRNFEELQEILSRVKYPEKMGVCLDTCHVFDGGYDISGHLEEVLEEENNVMFLPLHVLEQTIGYVALVFDPDIMRMNYVYQFFMNISNALETTKTHQRQQAIINNLEIKYIHDPMTGLFNRRGFYQRLEPVYNICAKESCKVLVMSVDLNGLKQINDTYGHADGDIAITTIGKALSYVASDKHTCARFGGDEFVVAGPVENDEEGEEFYKEVLAYLDRFNEKSNRPYQVSASIGYVTGTPDNGITLDEFIKAADEKMYQEKVRYHSRQGR